MGKKYRVRVIVDKIAKMVVGRWYLVICKIIIQRVWAAVDEIATTYFQYVSQ